MKILLVTGDMNIGGVTSAAISFCNHFSKQGNEIHCLNLGEKNGEVEAQFDREVKLLRLNFPSRLWNISYKNIAKDKKISNFFLFILGGIKKLTIRNGVWYKCIFFNQFKKNSYDIAIAFRQNEPCYFYVLNRIRAKKKIALIHGDINYMGNISTWDKYFHLFDTIACVSNFVREGFERKYPTLKKQFRTLYNLIPLDAITAHGLRKSSINYEKGTFNIVTVSRIENKHKNVDLIHDVVRILKQSTTCQFLWHIIGDGPHYEENRREVIRLGIDDKIIYHGTICTPYAEIKNADLLVVTSRTESFCLVVAESLALGTPVVMTDFPVAYELFKDIGSEYIVKNSPIEVANVISNIMKYGYNVPVRSLTQIVEKHNKTAEAQFYAL